jgi:rod shape-determining protein MreD
MKFMYKSDLKLYVYLLLLVYLPYAFYNLFSISIRPELLLITMFYFSITKLLNINLAYVMLIGLLNDELSNTVLGLHALMYVTISILGRSNANSLFKQKFSVVFLSFMLLVFISEFLSQVVNFSMNLSITISHPEILGIVVTMLLYPLLHYFYTIRLKWFVSKNER